VAAATIPGQDHAQGNAHVVQANIAQSRRPEGHEMLQIFGEKP
jgi:hypothetical protein